MSTLRIAKAVTAFVTTVTVFKSLALAVFDALAAELIFTALFMVSLLMLCILIPDCLSKSCSLTFFTFKKSYLYTSSSDSSSRASKINFTAPVPSSGDPAPQPSPPI
jgi:hypothetical protein